VFLAGPTIPGRSLCAPGAAVGGRRSLKFTKTPGLKYGFQPHAYFTSDRYTPGKVRFACDLLQDAKHPGECYVGLRDYTFKGREYLDGPSIVIKADGTVVVAGKPLAKVPSGKRAHLEIQLDLLPPGKSRHPRFAVRTVYEPVRIA
jgi:hypothetical protein